MYNFENIYIERVDVRIFSFGKPYGNLGFRLQRSDNHTVQEDVGGRKTLVAVIGPNPKKLAIHFRHDSPFNALTAAPRHTHSSTISLRHL